MRKAPLPDQAPQASVRNDGCRPYSEPYRSTPTFDQDTLPTALKQEHRTKVGAWAVIRMLEGRLRYFPEAGGSPCTLTAPDFFVVAPQIPHRVEPIGAMKMRIDFYDHDPSLAPP